MTNRKYADIAEKRASLDEVLAHMTRLAKEQASGSRQKPDAEETGSAIVNQSVYSFYAECLRARGVEGIEATSAQDWIADCIQVMLGEKDTKRLSMRELANRIAEAVNAEGIDSEDRWALYELCFMLTTQMSGKDMGHIKWADQCARRGTPEEKEPASLYKRAFRQLVDRDFRPRADEAPLQRMTLEQLLRSMERTEENCSPRFVRLPIGSFTRLCLIARSNRDSAGDADVYRCITEEHRFMEVASTYGGRAWDESERLQDFAGRITVGFLDSLEKQTPPRHELLQTYELCYEFIGLMADEAHSWEHRSLMRIENLPARYDVDMLQEAELEQLSESIDAFEEYEKKQGNTN